MEEAEALTHIQELLVLEHMPLARNVAGQAAKRLMRVDFDDCLSAAHLGLVEAALRFQPAKGEFTAYAYRRMDSRIKDTVRASMRNIGWSRAHRTGGMKQVAKIVEWPVYDGEAYEPPGDDAHLDDDIERNEQLAIIYQQMTTTRERAIIAGIVAGHSQADIATGVGVKRSRVSQIYGDLIRRCQNRTTSTVQ